MNRIHVLVVAAAATFTTVNIFADDKNDGARSSGAGATTEKNRMAGGVSEDMMKEFRALDADKDGYLTKSELASKPELANNFAKADKDKDGKLDPAEYQVLKAETFSKGGE